jgi:S-adenosyl methyltransferase
LPDGTEYDGDASGRSSGAIPYHLRSPAAFRGFFDSLDLLDPGLAPPPTWRPTTPPLPETTRIGGLVGVARKP